MGTLAEDLAAMHDRLEQVAEHAKILREHDALLAGDCTKLRDEIARTLPRIERMGTLAVRMALLVEDRARRIADGAALTEALLGGLLGRTWGAK